MAATDETPYDEGGEGFEDASALQPRLRWMLPPDLNRWLAWVGMVLIALSAWQTSAFLLRIVFVAWGYPDSVNVEYPNAYYSLVLLGGAALVLWADTRGTTNASSRVAQGLSYVAVSTAVLLIVTQVIAGADYAFRSTFGLTGGGSLPSLPAGVAPRASEVAFGLEVLGDAVPAAFALALIVVLQARWSGDQSDPSQESTPRARPRRSFIVAGLIGAVAYVVLAIVAHAGGGRASSNFSGASGTTNASGLIQHPSAVIECLTPLGVVVTSPCPQPGASAGGTSTARASDLPPLGDPCGAKEFTSALQPLNPPSNPRRYDAAPPVTIDTTRLYEATISTSRGTMVLCLQPSLAPLAVNSFVTLARNHFYDGLTFHRAVPNFVIQGGDPTKTGTGGPGYFFADEPVRAAYTAGAVAVANVGPNTNGSQFFVCIGDGTRCAALPPDYPLFGIVHTGLDVANRIQPGDSITSVSVAEQS